MTTPTKRTRENPDSDEAKEEGKDQPSQKVARSEGSIMEVKTEASSAENLGVSPTATPRTPEQALQEDKTATIGKIQGERGGQQLVRLLFHSRGQFWGNNKNNNFFPRTTKQQVIHCRIQNQISNTPLRAHRDPLIYTPLKNTHLGNYTQRKLG